MTYVFLYDITPTEMKRRQQQILEAGKHLDECWLAKLADPRWQSPRPMVGRTEKQPNFLEDSQRLRNSWYKYLENWIWRWG